jgi:hypothetical protein
MLLFILGLLSLAACDAALSLAPSVHSTLVSMNAQAWSILYSPGMPLHPTPQTGGMVLRFSDRPQLSPLRPHRSEHGCVRFCRCQHPGNHDRNAYCIYPAHVRFLLQEKGDDLSGKNAKRYFGSANLRAPLTDFSEWMSVFGEKADASESATTGFKQAIANLGNIGFSFGGSCFYGHGVRVSRGGARFAVASYAVN